MIAPIDIPKVCSLKFLAYEQQTHLAVSISGRAGPRIREEACEHRTRTART